MSATMRNRIPALAIVGSPDCCRGASRHLPVPGGEIADLLRRHGGEIRLATPCLALEEVSPRGSERRSSARAATDGSKSLAERTGRGFDHPQGDALSRSLLHADVGKNPLGAEWRTWFAAADVNDRRTLAGLSFQDPALSIQAAINGVGFAIAYIELIEADLASERLVQPFELAVQHSYSYYLVYPAARRDEPAIAEFRRWILSEVAREDICPTLVATG